MTKKISFWKITLIGLGTNACLIGAGLLLYPIWFESLFHVLLDRDASALSEVRAPGAGLLSCGILMIAGAFIKRLSFVSLLLTCFLYISYALGRVFGIIVDGLPNDSIQSALIFEAIAGIVAVLALTQFMRSSQGEGSRAVTRI